MIIYYAKVSFDEKNILIISLKTNDILVNLWYNKRNKKDKRVILMNSNKRQIEKEIQEKIKKVDGAMAQEGMPLTKEIKQKLYNCIIGKSTTEIERNKVLEKYRRIYG